MWCIVIQNMLCLHSNIKCIIQCIFNNILDKYYFVFCGTVNVLFSWLLQRLPQYSSFCCSRLLFFFPFLKGCLCGVYNWRGRRAYKKTLCTRVCWELLNWPMITPLNLSPFKVWIHPCVCDILTSNWTSISGDLVNMRK